VECYDHVAFPEKYRGALFLADWSIGVIWAVPLQRDGATYKGKAERFCTGAPMNVTDLAVAPDGSLYFTLGGRGNQGGV
jgi:glucose/arabinose dehydrogenase